MPRLLHSPPGYDGRCFMCHPDNPRGFHLAFVHDEEEGAVRTSMTFDRDFEGPPGIVHGGVLAAICDETAAWAVMALAGSMALIAELRTSYLAPVPVGEELTATGRVIGRLRRHVWVLVELSTSEGVRVRAEARATAVADVTV